MAERRPKILMFSWEYPPYVVGGLGQHVADLVPALAELGVEVHLVTPVPGGQGTAAIQADRGASAHATPEGGLVSVHRVPGRAVPGDILTQAVVVNQRLAREAEVIVNQCGPFDVIHAHDWLVSFAASAMKNRFRLPLVATIHATEYGRSQGHVDNALSRSIHAAEWELIYQAWRVIVCSNFMAGEVILALGTPPDKVDVIPNGVDAHHFDALKGLDHSALRAKFAAPEERIVFNVGRIVREKGLHVLVEAMPLVLKAAPDAKFVVAGKPDPWGYWEAARRRADALGVGDKAFFTGFLPDAERDILLTLADVAVFPSVYEPFGIVALEAMAAGAPTVASAAGGLGEVVIHELTGLTAPPDDPLSLASAIIETLRDPLQAQARARSAYARVVTEFNWRKIASETLAVYGRLVDQRQNVAW